MVGIPDYSSGATEHWGIITFRETAIYYNSKDSSSANKQRVATVISHEMAHQWFGNLGKTRLIISCQRLLITLIVFMNIYVYGFISLQYFSSSVTLKWWNDLWLNEGFASYVEYKGTAHVEPTWEMVRSFLFPDH